MAEILALHFGGYKKTMASILGMGAALSPPPRLSVGSVALESSVSRPHGEGLTLFNNRTSQAFRWLQL